ncbi:MAG: bifunctional phosphoribosylaminoimidazolecarboxamide formyltransferase/IMP cyclohydrolase [Thermoplasmata archaeon]|nr:bifunctional phosphoribosylaminoimidazolecarboxamide formyltransferase/IMP cyclohydrolase [Thermoplasmata archaeon]
MPSDRAGLVPVRRALLSVDERTGLATLARALQAGNVEVIATQGTRDALSREGVPTRPAEDLTGIGAWFGGRIKTLHPGLLGGILAPRTPEGDAELARRDLLRIDLVAVNFYPFARRLAQAPQADDLEEFVDVGGVSLARAAAKNHAAVAVLTSPDQYPLVVEELTREGGYLSAATRLALAVAAFERTAAYDATISRGIARAATSSSVFPDAVEFRREALQLRYGENPHQPAAVFQLDGPAAPSMSAAPLELLKGDALSFTNLLDLETALAVVSEFATPTAAIVKHATPVGVASADTVGEAMARAVATDPIARYGGVLAVNRPLRADDPVALHGVFVDLLGAPAVDLAARTALDRRAKLKLVRVDPYALDRPQWEAHSALGRLLLQHVDRRQLAPSDYRCVTRATATASEASSMEFAWRVVRHAKSNAVVLAQGSETVGIGSGQPTRVKAVELALEVAGERAKGSVLASDAFFPFADGVEAAGKAGVRVIIQPGGSVRDEEVLAAAERYGIAMYCTGWRVFRH